MALCAWFPLIGTLDNQGTDNVSFTTTNASFQNDGKLGKCIKLGYSSNFTVPSLVKSKQISIAYWVKINTATSTQWLDPIHYYSNTPDGTGSGSVTRQEFYSNCTLTGFWFDNGSMSGVPITVGEWTHFAITVDYSSGIAKMYKNGTLVKTATTVNTSAFVTGNNFRIGENGLDLSENDVRIYNHILSPKEVELLARGLIVHYPLSDPYVEDTTNLCNVQYISAGTSGGWGGHSGVVSVIDSSDFNIPCTQCNKLVISYSGSGGGGFGRGVQNITVSPSTAYTCSFYFKTSENFTSRALGNLIYIREYNSSGTQIREAGIWSSINKEYVGDGWYRLWGTFTTQSSTVKIQPCVYVYPDSNQEYYFGCWQVEQKDHMTPYILGLRSERIIYDTSGYSHDGTNTSSLITNSNSSRYGICTYFENDTNVITAPITIGDGSAITLSCWVRSKNGTQGKGGYQMPLNINAAPYEFSIPSSGKFRQGFHINGTRYVNDYGSVNLLDTNWHMISATYDGTNIKRYVDGVLVNTTAVTGALTTGTLNLCIGKYYGSTVYGSIELYESDVRIYSTALSATQVAELYNTSASIANNGTLLAYEFIEN